LLLDGLALLTTERRAAAAGRVDAFEDDDVEVRILLDEASELAELRDGRRPARSGECVSQRVLHRGSATASSETPPGAGVSGRGDECRGQTTTCLTSAM